MARYQRKAIEESPERQIVLGMVVSDRFIKEVQPILRPDLLESPWAMKVIGWCQDYHVKFGKAPGVHIEDIFRQEVEQGNLDDDQESIISKLLGTLSDEYERSKEFNAEFLLDRAEKYFESRNLEKKAANIKALLVRGDVAAAQVEFNSYQSVSRPGSMGVDPFSDRDSMLSAFEYSAEPLFRMPGAVGRFLNDLMEREAFVTLLGPEKRGKCLDEDTPIVLPDGRVKAIKDVVLDRDPEIMSFNEKTMKLEPKAISGYWDNGKKNTCKVITRTGREIVTTFNHPYLTPSGWKNVKDIQIGERIAVPCNIPCFGNIQMKEYKIKLLAYLITEGGLYSNSDLRFCSTYIDIQKDFIECVEQMGDKISDKIANNKDFSIINHEFCKGLHSKNQTGKWITELGLMGKRSKDKFIPDCIFSLPKPQLKLFLNILFSCDGSVYKEGIEYSSASKKMIHQVYHLLLRFGIVGNISKSIIKERDYWAISIKNRDGILKFIDDIGFSFHKMGIAQEVKKKQLQKKRSNCFLTTIPPEFMEKIYQESKGKIPKVFQEVIRTARKNKTNISHNIVKKMSCFSKTAEILSLSDVIWDSVIEKIDMGERNTYDLTVPDFHNFVAGDIIAHNTWMLIEISLWARRAGLNVAFFSAGDMSQSQLEVRFGIRFAGRSNRPKNCGEILVPVLDCKRNQDDTCDNPNRAGTFAIMDPNTKQLLPYEECPDHNPCTYCMKNPGEQPGYKGASWLRVRPPVPVLDGPGAAKAAQRMARRWGKKARMKLIAFPNDTLTISRIDQQLDAWESQESFIPDVIVIDYMDLIVPDTLHSGEQVRHGIGKIWGGVRRMSQERHCLVLSASQSDTESYDTKWITSKNFSESKQKNAHVTGMITLNQTREEKRRKVMRLGTILTREEEFDDHKGVTILQSLEQGRPLIASF
jgi:intein/homing endonuclease